MDVIIKFKFGGDIIATKKLKTNTSIYEHVTELKKNIYSASGNSENVYIISAKTCDNKPVNIRERISNYYDGVKPYIVINLFLKERGKGENWDEHGVAAFVKSTVNSNLLYLNMKQENREAAEELLTQVKEELSVLENKMSRLDVTDDLEMEKELMKCVKKMREASEKLTTADETEKAADSALDAACCYEKYGDSKSQSAKLYHEAAILMMKSRPEQAVNCLEKTVKIYTKSARFTLIAQTHGLMAEVYETELHNLEKCIIHYQKAAENYTSVERDNDAHRCLAKVAIYSAEIGKYAEAIDLFDKLAHIEAEQGNFQFSKHLLRSFLCHLNVEHLNAKQALMSYLDALPAFSNSKEYRIVEEVFAAHESKDLEKLDHVIDKLRRNDVLDANLLLRVKLGIMK